MALKANTTKVKFSKDGVEQEKDVDYSVELAESAADVVRILKTKLTEDEQKSENVEALANDKMVDYVNQILESNARQAARAAFLAQIDGPDKAIKAMAKKLAAVKGISIEEAEKAIRAIM